LTEEASMHPPEHWHRYGNARVGSDGIARQR